MLSLLKALNKSGCNICIVLLRYCIYKSRGKKILPHEKVTIKGLHNIFTQGLLRVGINFVGFESAKDRTLINVTGKLNILGNVSIGRGGRLSIDGEFTIGNDSYINSNCLIIIQHRLTIGRNCAISWNCQFLDDDFHLVDYEGKRKKAQNDIFIGDDVLIGNNTFIYKGTYIPHGCVVAANSVIKGMIFDEPNSLIAGNPARVVKHNIKWS